MLGDYLSFLKADIEGDSTTMRLELLMDRCGMILHRFINEIDMERIVDFAREIEILPTRAFINFGASALILGSTCSKLLTKKTKAEYRFFEIEKYIKTNWKKANKLLKIYYNLTTDKNLIDQIYGGTASTWEGGFRRIGPDS